MRKGESAMAKEWRPSEGCMPERNPLIESAGGDEISVRLNNNQSIFP